MKRQSEYKLNSVLFCSDVVDVDEKVLTDFSEPAHLFVEAKPELVCLSQNGRKSSTLWAAFHAVYVSECCCRFCHRWLDQSDLIRIWSRFVARPWINQDEDGPMKFHRNQQQPLQIRGYGPTEGGERDPTGGYPTSSNVKWPTECNLVTGHASALVSIGSWDVLVTFWRCSTFSISERLIGRWSGAAAIESLQQWQKNEIFATQIATSATAGRNGPVTSFNVHWLRDNKQPKCTGE